MKVLYAPLWQGVQRALNDIFVDQRPADKVIQHHLKFNKKWGSSDRRLFAESVYDLVRWWRRLLFVTQTPWPGQDTWRGEDPTAHTKAIEAWCLLNDVQLGKGVSSTGLSRADVESLWQDPSLERAVRHAVPNWLDQWGIEELSEKWEPTLQALNTVAPVFLRCNRLKTKPDQLVRELEKENIQAETLNDDVIRLKKRANVFLTKAFKNGLFEVQDVHSQRVAPTLNVEPGLRVIDACAGAGGKSLHLAALMQNKGKVIAMDVAEHKLEQLRQRSTRAGATCIEARVIDGSKAIKRLADSGDRLLLDVPCSGLGVLRRNPDSKWKLTMESVQKVKELQKQILSQYVSMCRSNGEIVYSTCSIMPSENQQQVEAFLSSQEGRWQIKHQETLLPSQDGGDGFFIARLVPN